MKVKQKEIFLKSEGDMWFSRNQQKIANRKFPNGDLILKELLEIIPSYNSEAIKILETGCGEGSRLSYIKDNFNTDCFGIDPSAKAVDESVAKGIKARQGTADTLPFEDNTFDIIIFGFCLYLCDRDDLFRIASEADRILRQEAWVIILDFFSKQYRSNDYSHYPGIKSFKMDYRTMFTWHPSYECLTHKVRHHVDSIYRLIQYTDAQDDWVAVSVLRKRQI